MEQILENIGEVFKFFISIIPSILNLIGFEEKIINWIIKTVIGILIIFAKPIYKAIIR